MKHSLRLVVVLLLTLFALIVATPVLATQAATTASDPQQQTTPTPALAGEVFGPGVAVPGQVHGLYFYSVDCPHCQRAYEEVIQPLQAQYGAKLDLRMVEISQPENYELLIQAETTFQVTAEQRGLPTLIIGDQILIGEDPVRQRLPDLVSQGVANGVLDWPTIPGFDPQGVNSRVPTFGSAEGSCEVDNAASCETAAPIYAAYFYQVGCQACSR
ncbi:MAG: hypothetical protein GYA59_08135, partial [Chloroflexi bacterium]|nr:hypothetical protein [Chloroflexota bacterium]